MEKILQARYRIVRPLGPGGRDAVFLCEDLRLSDKRWAVKQVLCSEPGLDGQLRERLESEMAALSSLQHPSLPRIVDSFLEDGRAYLVMEYVEGESLAEHARRRGPLSEREAFEKGRALAGLLELLHGQAPPVLFRDLDPENVMVSTTGEIKLIDLDLASRSGSGAPPGGPSGRVAGSLSAADVCADLQAWGAAMVTLLSGQAPSPAALEGLPLSDAGRAITLRSLRPASAGPFASATALHAAVTEHLSDLEETDRVEPAVREPVVRRDDGTSGAPSRHDATTVDLVPLRDAKAPTAPPSLPATTVPDRHARASLLLLIVATVAFIGACALAFRHVPPHTVSQGPSPSAVAVDGVLPYRRGHQPNPRREEGLRAYRERRWTDAIAAFDEAAARCPDDAEAHILAQNARVRSSGRPFVTIPYIGTTSGVDGPEAYAHLYGLALGQAAVNDRGGIGGRKVVLDCYDDESSIARCLKIVRGVIADPAVQVVLGPTNSQRTLAVAPLFNVGHVSAIAPAASAAAVWEAGPYIFSASDAREPRLRALARHVTRNAQPRIAIIPRATMRLSLEMAQMFEAEATRLGATCLQGPPCPEDAQDFTSQIDFLKSVKPDVVFLSDYRAAPIARFAVALRQAGLQVPICSQAVPFASDLVDVGGAAVDGLITTEYFHPDIDTPGMRAFVTAFHRKFGDITPVYASANAFDAFNAAVDGLAHATTRESLNAYLRATGVSRPAFEGVGGPFALGRRLDARPIRLIEVRGGRYRLLDSATQK